MISQFDNILYASVFLWAQNRVQNQAQAYITVNTPLYYAPDPTLPLGLLSYSAPFATWVYDSGVSGAAIIQTVSGSNGIIYGRNSGFIFDYINGRVLVPSGFGTNLSLGSTYSFSEVNTYQPNEDEDHILTQGQYYLNPSTNGAATGGAPPNVYHTPAIFINTLHSDDKAFAFGGLDDSITTFSISIFAQSNWQLNALLSLFRDSRYLNIPLLPATASPLNQWNDYNGGTGYNYSSYIAAYGSPGQLCYLSDIKTSKVSDRIKANREYFVGLVDLEIGYVRQTS